MIAIDQISTSSAQRLEGIFFDLDDTFLSEGKLSEDAYRALFRLQESGLRLIALTGRPASWARLIAQMWPLEGAVAENGALGMQRINGRVRQIDFLPADRRLDHQNRLQRLVDETRRQLPTLVPSDDVQGRISDFTFDIGEYERVDEKTIVQARALAAAHGAKTTLSSVHLHFTYDNTDKAVGALQYLRLQGEDTTRSRSTFAFIGDSQNDAPAFAAFKLGVGVKNLTGDFSIRPRYQSRFSASRGFCELAAHLVAQRESSISTSTVEPQLKSPQKRG